MMMMALARPSTSFQQALPAASSMAVIGTISKFAQCLGGHLTSPQQQQQQVRGIARIPKWEYHIRFDSSVGRKVPSRDVLERFKRLNNGVWIRQHPGRYKMRYAKQDEWRYKTMQAYMCTQRESQMLDAMVTPFWLRPKHYVDDPYKPYHSRHNLPQGTPRMDNWNRQMRREQPKILLDDTTVDKYFHSR